MPCAVFVTIDLPSSQWALWVSARRAVSSAAHELRERGEGRKKKETKKEWKNMASSWREGGVTQRGKREMSRAGCCLWLSFIRALHLMFHATNVRSVCSAALCLEEWKCCIHLSHSACILLPQTGPGPCHPDSYFTPHPDTKSLAKCPPDFQTRERGKGMRSHPVLCLSGRRQTRENGEYVLMPQIPPTNYRPKEHQKHICMPNLSDTSIAFWHLQSGGEKSPAFLDRDNGNRQPD